MGTVYLARAVGVGGFERLVAIKRAHENLLSTEQAAQRFLDEARIVAQVHHANVVGIHQVGHDAGGYYLVLDYVEGESLGGLIARATRDHETIPPAIVVRVALDALAGLHAAHETTDGAGTPLGILHRDVSIQNMLVGRDGVTRLTDFGVAKSTLSSVVTDAGYVQGKLVYMPPEYLRRQSVDRTLDIYSMGITLFTAFTGQHPWHGQGHAEIVQAILGGKVPTLSEMGVLVPELLEGIVARACSRDPTLRFQTARQMLDALEAAGRETGCLARHMEVAEYVERLAGAELRERREAINNQRVLAENTGEKTEESTLPIASGATQAAWRKSWVTADLSDSGVVELEETLAPRRSRGKRLAVAAVALAAVGGALGWALSGEGPDSAPTSGTSAETSQPKTDTAPSATEAAAEQPALPSAAASDALGSGAAPAGSPGQPSRSRGTRTPRTGSKRSGTTDKLNQISTTNPYRQRAPQ
jgi:serine/threonine-protein kinase